MFDGSITPRKSDFVIGLETAGIFPDEMVPALVPDNEPDDIYTSMARDSLRQPKDFFRIWVSEFIEAKTAFDSEKGNPEKHYVLIKILELLNLRGDLEDHDVIIAINKCFQAEGMLDELMDLLTCPITLSVIKDPVLLSSGHMAERSAIERWSEENGATNPLTKEPLVYYKETVVAKLIHAIQTKFAQHIPESEKARLAIQELMESPFSIEDSVRWCRILSIVMPPKTFYVRLKGKNHFVLEARLPLDDTNSMYSVLKVSFCIQKDGKIQLIQDPTQVFNSLKELLAYYRCTNFRPVSQEERQEIEETVGKHKILTRTCLLNVNQFAHRENLLTILKHLELRFSDADLSLLLRANPETLFFRAGISQTSYPTITVSQFKEGKLFKVKLALVNGDLVGTNPFYYKKDDAKCLIKYEGENKQSVVKMLEELDKDHPIEGRILEEMDRLLARGLATEGPICTGFYLPAHGSSYLDEIAAAGRNIYMLPETQNTGYLSPNYDPTAGYMQ